MRGSGLVGTARAEFLVFDRDVELSTPAADPDLMASLAAWTRQEGGRAVAPRGAAAAAGRAGQAAAGVRSATDALEAGGHFGRRLADAAADDRRADDGVVSAEAVGAGVTWRFGIGGFGDFGLRFGPRARRC